MQTLKSFEEIEIFTPGQKILGRTIDALVRGTPKARVTNALDRFLVVLGEDKDYQAARWLAS